MFIEIFLLADFMTDKDLELIFLLTFSYFANVVS